MFRCPFSDQSSMSFRLLAGAEPVPEVTDVSGYQFKPCKYNQFLPKGVLLWQPNFDEKRHCDIFPEMSWNIGGKSITLQSL